MNSPPCGLIFDLDGTLIDTLEDIVRSVNEVLDATGTAPLPRERIRAYVGEGLANLLQQASGLEDAGAVDDLVARYKPIYRRRMFEHTHVYPGLGSALDALSAAGCPLAILSNKSHEFVVPLVDMLLARWTWVAARGSRPDAARKPDPGQALELAAAMSRAAHQVVFVGDSAIDVHTAQNAGMTAVAVTWGYRDRAELLAAGATILVEHPQDLASRLLHGLGASR